MPSEIFSLSADGVRAYLRQSGLIPASHEVHTTELGGGISNTVVLIEGPNLRWVAKQSLGKLRVKDDWHSDRDRIFFEAQAIEAFRGVLGEGSVPGLIHIDNEHFLVVMTAAPEGARPWKDLLLEGQIDLDVARQAGIVLARMINVTCRNNIFRKKFHDRRIFEQLRITPYYRTTAAIHPDVRPAIEQLISSSWATQTSVVHGDYSPKNMLVCNGNIFLIDFEVVHWGDPAFDSGFLLTHLFLKAFHRPRLAHSYLHAASEFWEALTENLEDQATQEFERMTIRHLSGLLLARIDGKSPVEYIVDEATRAQVRSLAKRVLLEPSNKLDLLLESTLSDLEL